MSEHSISVVVVTYRHGEAVRPALDALSRELREGDELIVIDNASGDDTSAVVADAAPWARWVPSQTNEGFPRACNRGAARAAGELLVFLNPDAVVDEGWREAIAAPLANGSGWTAWQALVTADRGRLVNTRGGEVHYTGIAWAGGAGEPIGKAEVEGEPGFCSGACFAIGRAAFERLGGFAEDFFLYHEDVDLSLRVRLGGGQLGVAANARADHLYEFDKGPAKWRYLERNRWATILRVYPAALLLLLAPALAATELALLAVSAVGGWLPQKLASWGDVLRALPRLARQRREVQATAKIGAGEFAAGLTPALASAYLGPVATLRPLSFLLRAYWRVVSAVLRAGRSA